MEMRSVGILVLGVVALTLAVVVPPAQPYILAAMAVIPLGVLAVGQVILPRSKRSIRVWFNPIFVEMDDDLIPLSQGTAIGRLSGRNLAHSYFKQWHDFEIIAHRFWLLAGIGLISLAGIWMSWRVEANFATDAGFYYFTFFSWVTLVGMAKRWAWERRMLRLEGVSIATFSVTANHWYQQIRYHFVDREGTHRGGWFESMVCDKADDLTIVFYDEENPDRSIPASALLFHKLVWKEPQPLASRNVDSANA
jgi:hypothetical protein